MVRVLIVDDDPDICYVLRDALTGSGYVVEGVSNGAEALETIRRWRPDAILLDLIMPVVDGWSFLDAYEGDPACRGVPVAVLSAAPEAGSAIQDRGVWALIPKPFDVGAVVSTVDELVRHSFLRRRARSHGRRNSVATRRRATRRETAHAGRMAPSDATPRTA